MAFQFDSSDFLTCNNARLNVIIGKIILKYNIKTPFYLYSKTQIINNFLNYKNSFENLPNIVETNISYSVKANYNPHILKLLQKNQSWCSLVNGNELELCLKCGFSGSNLIFNGNGKTTDEIELAIKNSCYLNIDSEFNLNDTLHVCKRLNKPVNILIRINPSIDAKVHQYLNTSIKTSKFGINLDQLENIIEKIKANPTFLNLVGYHCHLGSTITALDVYEKCVDCLIELVDRSEREYGINTLQMINIGGGLGIDYYQHASRTSETAHPVAKLPTPHDLASVLAERFKNRDKKLKVIVEPGRSLIANTCILVTKLLGVKKNVNLNFLVVDASMCECIRPCLYSAYHFIDFIEPVDGRGNKILFDIVGPVCESGDFLGKDRVLSEPVVDNDSRPVYLSIFDVGAYCGSMASNYNMRLRPAEVMVDDNDDNLQLLRRSDTFEDLIRPFGDLFF
jgi:diaminopimelate decarboxylase